MNRSALTWTMIVAFIALVCSSMLSPAPRAAACATAWSTTASPPRIDAEQALIVWDAAQQREHFIRQADFAGATAEFGFLVPTPSRPELGEADRALFTRLAAIYSEPPRRPRATTMRAGSRGLESSSSPVIVVETRRVAGLDATVLLASDARALGAWLREHGFEGRPELEAWLSPYVARGFYLTAFRYIPGRDSRALGAPVRLSFTTATPFYPYAEPAGSPRPSGRRFVLSVVSTERVQGMLGSAAWTARTAYAGEATRLLHAIGDSVPAGTALGHWMTTFEETSSVRGAADLTFVRATDPSTVAPSVHATYRYTTHYSGGPLDPWAN